MKRKKPLQTKNTLKIKKWEQLRRYLVDKKFISDGYYLVVEVVTSEGKNLKHHHLKGCRGGI
jgi:hypothetical protein